jgi:hypothetical protein
MVLGPLQKSCLTEAMTALKTSEQMWTDQITVYADS